MPTATFTTTLSSFGNNTGIEVPEAVIAELGAGKRPAVVATVNGYEFRTTVGVMGGKQLVPVSAAIRKAAGLAGGDKIKVTLTVAEGPREVDVPADLRAALDAEPAAATFFAALSNSLQRYHVDNVNGAKSADTRARRVEKAVALFLAGKPR
jgi:hypothetical protein